MMGVKMTKRMVTLLIVDDEAEIREGIHQTISWDQYGIAVVGLAANGQEALELIDEIHPQMILLDIRMPIMNGLELLEKLSLRPRRPRVIIISGYDDFYYCQKALQNGAEDYLLKPCHPHQIVATLSKLSRGILAEECQAQRLAELRSQFRENLNLLREKFIADLLRTDQFNLQTAMEKWHLYELGIPPQNIGVALVRIDRNGYSRENLELQKLAVHNLMVAAFDETPAIHCFICDQNDDLFILWEFTSESAILIRARLEALRQRIVDDYSFTVTIGLGSVGATFGDLYQAYHSALWALEHSFWLGTNRLIDYEEIETEEGEFKDFPATEESAIIQCIRTNDAARLNPAVESFFNAISRIGEKFGNAGKEQVLRLITALVCSVYHVCVERGIDTGLIFGAELSILDELSRVETIAELKQRVTECLANILTLSPAHKNSWKVVNKALEYIREHFQEDLSLESLARQVFVSPGYLSTLFKKELQKNFTDCLHEVRIDQAKECLRNEQLKVYEIALAVGYRDEKYFSQVFKKWVGLSPNQYRELLNA